MPAAGPWLWCWSGCDASAAAGSCAHHRVLLCYFEWVGHCSVTRRSTLFKRLTCPRNCCCPCCAAETPQIFLEGSDMNVTRLAGTLPCCCDRNAPQSAACCMLPCRLRVAWLLAHASRAIFQLACSSPSAPACCRGVGLCGAPVCEWQGAPCAAARGRQPAHGAPAARSGGTPAAGAGNWRWLWSLPPLSVLNRLPWWPYIAVQPWP